MKSSSNVLTFESLTFRLWRVIVSGAPLWWIAGLNLFIYHAVAGFFFLALLYMSNRVESGGVLLAPSAKQILFITFFYALSIILQTFLGDADTSRVVAAGYNLSFWIMGFMLILVLSNKFKGLEVTPLLRAFERLAWVIAICSFGIIIFWIKGGYAIEFPTLLSPLERFFGGSQLVKDSLTVRPLAMDWFASAARPRFNVFSPYPTAAGGVIMITLIMLHTQFLVERKKMKWHFWVVVGLCLLGLVMTLSRTSMMALLFALVVVTLLERRYMFFWIFAGLGLFFIALPFLIQLIGMVLEMRSGSTSVRMDLYRYSIERLDGIDWIFGLGVKEREQAFFIPLGSHSTFISLLYKSGLLGLISYVIFQASLLWRWFSLKAKATKRRKHFLFWRALGLVFFGMFFWTMTEDIDAPQLLAFLYFSLVGIFEGFRRKLMA